MTKRTQLRGIVVAGNSLEEVQNLYRAVATGSDVMAMHDEDDTFVVLASAKSDILMLNPLTGADDMVEGDGLVDQMEFLSSNVEDVDTHYTVCASGCGAHIIADDMELLRHCPACASEVFDMDQDAITDAIAKHTAELLDQKDGGDASAKLVEGEEVKHVNHAIASGATLEDAINNYRSMVLGETTPSMVRSENVLIAVAGAADFDAYTGAEAKVVEEEADFLSAEASTADEVVAHHFVCASSDCSSPHVVSSDDMPVFCPSCSSGLLDPSDDLEDIHSAVASDDDDDEDEDEDDKDKDDEDGLDDDEDEDEDDDSDEDEDDDSDEDDEDEDDDSDEDDEDDDSDEDDDKDDEEVSLSLSSTRGRNRLRRRVPAQASATQDVQQVQASFLSLASAEAQAIDKLHVAYASNVLGENVWYATMDRVPVAIAVASKTQHKDIFNSEVFGRAVLAQARENGIQEALASMGFEEIKPEIEIGDYVANEIRTEVNSRLSEINENVERERGELHDRFCAALAIAATGITRGFFKDRCNLVAKSLISSLSAVGIQNAEALVNQAFVTHSDNYHKELLAQARVIMNYDLDVQNQLAAAVAESTPAAAPAEALSVGRPVASAQEEKIESQSSAQPNQDFALRLQQAMSGLGARR